MVEPNSVPGAELIVNGKMQVEYFTEIAGEQQIRGVRYAPGNNLFGVKGSYDLGEGLKSVAQVQLNAGSGRPCDHGASNMFGGLAGDWGTVLIGPYDAPTYIASAKTHLSSRTLLSSCDILGARGQNRTGVIYISPSFSGLQMAWMLPYSNDMITNDFAVTYRNGPFYLSVADQEIQDPDGIKRYRTDFTGNMFDFNGLTLGLFYSWVRKDDGHDAAAGLFAWPPGALPERETWRLEYAYSFGNNTIKVETGGALEGDDGRRSRFTASAFEHNNSKRRSLFTGQMHTVTEAPGRPVQEQTTVSHGLLHTF